MKKWTYEVEPKLDNKDELDKLLDKLNNFP